MPCYCQWSIEHRPAVVLSDSVSHALCINWLTYLLTCLSPARSVLCCCLHRPPAVPEPCCPRVFLQSPFPGIPG